jgi:tetratricopeptide (TPR) repeat protein
MSNNPQEWQALTTSAIRRKQAGDVTGAITDMENSLSLMRGVPDLVKQIATNLNYLADLLLREGLIDRAEATIREASELSRGLDPVFHADNLLILAEILSRKQIHREAIAAAEEALSLYRKHYGDFPERVTQVEQALDWVKSRS